MCPSFETYAFELVEKYELVREPGLTAAPCAIAASIPLTFVTSPSERKTATTGACSPLPNVFSVRWFASYAE